MSRIDYEDGNRETKRGSRRIAGESGRGYDKKTQNLNLKTTRAVLSIKEEYN